MTIFSDTETDGIRFGGAVSFVGGSGLAEGILIHDAMTTLGQAGGILADTIHLHLTQSQKQKLKYTLTDATLVHDAIHVAFQILLAQGFSIHPSQVVAYGLAIIQKFKALDAATAQGIYGKSLTDQVSLAVAAALFLGGFLNDGLLIHPAVTPIWQFVRRVSDNAGLHDAIIPSLLVSMTLADDMNIEDVDVLQWILTGTLIDGISMSAGYVSPSGSFTTWAINTRTSAVTEYDDFVFNSFARMGNNYLGANAEGLWQLGGATDNGLSIPTSILSGLMQLGGSHFTSFKAAYLGVRTLDGGRDFILKLHAGDNREYVYAVTPRNMKTTKVDFGKGLRSRYFAWELVTLGADYDLDSVEFVPIITQRRV